MATTKTKTTRAREAAKKLASPPKATAAQKERGEQDVRILKAFVKLEGADKPEGKEFTANQIGAELRARRSKWQPTDKILGQSHLRRLVNAGMLTHKPTPRPIKYKLTAKGRKAAA